MSRQTPSSPTCVPCTPSSVPTTGPTPLPWPATWACSRPRPAAPAKPTLLPARSMTPDLTWCFPSWMAFWVRQGGRDRDTEELQGVSPDAGRLGEHRHAGRGSVTAAELVTPDGDLSA